MGVVDRFKPEVIAPTIPDDVDSVRPDELILGMLGILGNDDVNCEVREGLKVLLKPAERPLDRPDEACIWLPTVEPNEPPREEPLVI